VPNVSVVDWQATDERGKFVGSVALAAGTTDIALQTGSLFRGEQRVTPRWVLVDNLANNANVPVSFGPFSYTVPRYQREVFKIPVPLATFRAVVSTGTVVVTFAEERDSLIAGADQFAIQQAANQFVSYLWQTLTVGRAQIVSDQNTNLNLTNAGAQNYSLLGIGATPIPNGWFNPEVKNTGAGRWSIVPSGADQINSLWTNANPLRLSTRDSVRLWCDGAQWQATGTISFASAQQAHPGLGGLITVAHGLVRTPVDYDMFLQCTTADTGYAIGDEILVPKNAFDGTRCQLGSVYADATNLYFRANNNFAGATVANKTTGASVNVLMTSWRIVLRASLDL
jgi:hypothetical protein